MMKIFINNVNTYSGSCFCKTFDEIKNEKTTIYGTVDDHNLSKEDCIFYNYDNVKKIISKIPKDNIVKYILKCKLVIYDLHNTDLEEIEYVIRKLKYEKIKHNMTIILISSIMTWSKTKRKFIKKIVEENKEITKNQSNNITHKSGETNNNLEKKENQNIETKNEKTSKKKDKKKNENYNKNNKIVDHGVHNKQANIIKNEDAKSNIQEIHIEEIKKKEKILYIPQIFNEKDYLKRISSTHFDEYKSVETLMLSLNSMKNIKTHVVVSGLLYGNGENVFFSIFKNAWLSKDNHIIDKGDNYIPVIHIRGLCEYIKQLYISESKKKYLIAVDNQYITQKEIIHTIASHISGNMNFMHVSPHESIFYEHSEKLCVNLRFQCTNIYDDNQVDEQEKKKKLNKKNKNKNKNDEGDISDHHKEDNHSETDNNDSEKKESNTEDDNIDSEQNSSINMNNSNDDSQNSSNSESNNNDDNDSNNSNEKKKGKKENNNLKEKKNKSKNKNKKKNLITFHCQDGFINNISIIAKEFCEFRNLKNLKVLIIGQPGVGKTFIAKKICDHYNLIMCSINMLIDEYKKKTDYTFPKYYQEYINELDNEKKKNVPPKKLTLSDLCSLFYSKLENNECKFRGFVLDFFPRNYEEAKYFFDNYKMDVPEKEKEMKNGKRDEDDTNRKGNNKSKKKIKKKKNERNDKEEDDNDKDEDDNDKDEDDNDKEEDDNDKDEDDNDKEEDENDKDEDNEDNEDDENDKDEDDKDEDDKDEDDKDEDDKDEDDEDDNDKDEDDNDKEEDDNDNDNNIEENDNTEDSDYREDNDDEKISGNSENTNMMTHSDEESQSVKQMSNKKKKKKKKKKILENINKYIIMPEFVIILKSTEELCKKRMMNLPENEIIKGHNDEMGFERRHKKYINENCRNDYFEFDQKQSIEDYFIEHDIEVYTLNINENTLLEHILTNIYIFIEKNVKFNNFLPSTDEMLKNKLQEEQQILMDEKQKIKDIEDKVVLEEIKQNDDLIKAEKKRQQLLIKHQQQYIHNQSVPLRFYLIKNILPILTDALIYICKTKPKNPCLHIAQYLLENAHKYNIEEPNLENLQPEKEDEDNQLGEKPKDEK
ncbi:hypothetical protein PFUGPA_05880 [Plasmodium falciparum Palo Alto/Uganda]|uniref:P-loop containing nucleoside triphosphate hydrolase n=2 Tax=Plasmodium falciparum TaxID=5833 RepID=W4IS48_PLAFP|nr:hypothetical protein PFUGPA_05880 [Plasmodium falciparum Palo Alto/Uganda]ETW63684.1 hypothetical protein PFMC_00431 [Plasmodium falciparum CAMP/Malaysia]